MPACRSRHRSTPSPIPSNSTRIGSSANAHRIAEPDDARPPERAGRSRSAPHTEQRCSASESKAPQDVQNMVASKVDSDVQGWFDCTAGATLLGNVEQVGQEDAV